MIIVFNSRISHVSMCTYVCSWLSGFHFLIWLDISGSLLFFNHLLCALSFLNTLSILTFHFRQLQSLYSFQVWTLLTLTQDGMLPFVIVLTVSSSLLKLYLSKLFWGSFESTGLLGRFGLVSTQLLAPPACGHLTHHSRPRALYRYTWKEWILAPNSGKDGFELIHL